MSGPATATRGAFAVAFAFLRTSKFHIGPPTSTTLVMPLRMYRAKTSCRCDLIHATSSLYGRTLLKSHLHDVFARYIRSGITSVVDVGGPMWNFEVRKQANATAKAPRVAVA